MRAALGLAVVLSIALAHVGCTPVREIPQINDQVTDPTVDAWMANGTDGGIVTHPNDAWVPPQNDAWVAPQPDAGSCPTYTNDVEPIYVMHCADCHTTGGNPHFGSSYTVANQSFSSCGNSMAQCTIDRGQPGGDMAFRDALGGFSASDLATLNAWIACGRPR